MLPTQALTHFQPGVIRTSEPQAPRRSPGPLRLRPAPSLPQWGLPMDPFLKPNQVTLVSVVGVFRVRLSHPPCCRTGSPPAPLRATQCPAIRVDVRGRALSCLGAHGLDGGSWGHPRPHCFPCVLQLLRQGLSPMPTSEAATRTLRTPPPPSAQPWCVHTGTRVPSHGEAADGPVGAVEVRPARTTGQRP